MNVIPLEDNYTDVVGKAQRGLRLSDADLAQRAGISSSELGHFKEGGFDAEHGPKNGRRPLNLGAEAP